MGLEGNRRHPLLAAAGILIALLTILPNSALGQVVCPAGLVTPDQVHCCWPGQWWSSANKSCAGEPECPAGYRVIGNNCVVSAAGPHLEQLPDQAAPVVVRFLDEAGRSYFVADPMSGQSCTAPCALTLPAGPHRLRITYGKRSFTQKLHVYPDRLSDPFDLRTPRRGMKAMGVAGLIVGPIFIGGTTLLTVMVAGTDEFSPEMMVAGYAVGAVALAAGCFGMAFRGQERLVPMRGQRGRLALPDSLEIGFAPTRHGAIAAAGFRF